MIITGTAHNDVRCPHCGAKLQPDCKTCPGCGAAVLIVRKKKEQQVNNLLSPPD